MLLFLCFSQNILQVWEPHWFSFHSKHKTLRTVIFTDGRLWQRWAKHVCCSNNNYNNIMREYYIRVNLQCSDIQSQQQKCERDVVWQRCSSHSLLCDVMKFVRWWSFGVCTDTQLSAFCSKHKYTIFCTAVLVFSSDDEYTRHLYRTWREQTQTDRHDASRWNSSR